MLAKATYFKALYELDHGRESEAEALLRESLQKANLENDIHTTGSVLCLLGELMLDTGRPSEAEVYLRRFQFLKRSGDILAPEAHRVRELLEHLQAQKAN